MTDHPITAGMKAKKRGRTVFNSPAIRKRVANQIWQNRYIYLMVIPVLVYLALFKYMPMYYLRASFYDYKLLKGFAGSKYVGVKWFERLLTSPELWQYIRNTLTLNTLSLLICFPAPLVFALLLPAVCPECTWESALSISIASLSNVGPGAAQIGPAANFDWLNPAAKLLSAFEMLIGRLELFTILVLFLPSFWRK